jgi:hypothetical protein
MAWDEKSVGGDGAILVANSPTLGLGLLLQLEWSGELSQSNANEHTPLAEWQ